MLGIVLHLGRRSRGIEVTIKKKKQRTMSLKFSIRYVYNMYGKVLTFLTLRIHETVHIDIFDL